MDFNYIKSRLPGTHLTSCKGEPCDCGAALNLETDGDIPDFSNADWLTSIRYWLIRKLAGKTVVVLNARIQITLQTDGECAFIDDIDDALICDNSFPPPRAGQVLKFSRREAAHGK